MASMQQNFIYQGIKNAHNCYQQWGATVKVKHLETLCPQSLAEMQSLCTTTAVGLEMNPSTGQLKTSEILGLIVLQHPAPHVKCSSMSLLIIQV